MDARPRHDQKAARNNDLRRSITPTEKRHCDATLFLPKTNHQRLQGNTPLQQDEPYNRSLPRRPPKFQNPQPPLPHRPNPPTHNNTITTRHWGPPPRRNRRTRTSHKHATPNPNHTNPPHTPQSSALNIPHPPKPQTTARSPRHHDDTTPPKMRRAAATERSQPCPPRTGAARAGQPPPSEIYWPSPHLASRTAHRRNPDLPASPSTPSRLETASSPGERLKPHSPSPASRPCAA